jgi:predicted acylesterase/phospholipase RssA
MNSPTLRPIVLLIVAVLHVHAAYAQEENRPHITCPGEKKRAVVISGGGVGGAYQIGALWYLVNILDCEFDRFIGTSTGALTAATLAQSRNHEELKQRVDALKSDYENLRSRSDLVDEHGLGMLRLFVMPRGLGGIDGMATLAPVERRLRAHFGGGSIRPDRLTVTAVSLQAGALNPEVYRPDDLMDLAMGSASIPVAVEPRRARLWARATPQQLTGDVLTLSSEAPPGLPDPRCSLRLDESTSVRCEQIGAKVTMSLPSRETDIDRLPDPSDESPYVRADIQLRLPGLTAAQTRAIVEAIEKAKASVSPVQPPFEFSSVHQLVDGGVTDNIPLDRVVKLLGTKGGFDTFFLLLPARSSAIAGSPVERHGGRRILPVTFDLLWEAYQDKAFRAGYERLRYEKFLCLYSTRDRNAVAWLRAFRKAMGKGQFKAIQDKVSTPFPFDDGSSATVVTLTPVDPNQPDEAEEPEGKPLFDFVGEIAGDCDAGGWNQWRLWTVDPPDLQLGGSLTVDPAKIRAALVAGCMAAATVVYAPWAMDHEKEFTGEKGKAYARAACRSLLVAPSPR